MKNMTANDQKLLLAVSFGTSFADTREKTIGAIERRIAERFPDCTVQRCFTSRMIRKKLLERDGLRIDGPDDAIRKAQEKGIKNLIIQPLYLMHGFEHRRLMDSIKDAAPAFDTLAVGRPLLSDDSDFRLIAAAIQRNIPAPEPDTAVVLMGHGNEKKKKQAPEDSAPAQGKVDAASGQLNTAPTLEQPKPASASPQPQEELKKRDIHDNAVFEVLQETLLEAGADNYFIATVEGEPEIGDILPLIKERGFRKVILAPFMVVAGDHARNDLAGDAEDSWKSIFLQNGFEVETVLRGIGEWEEVQDLFAAHAAQLM